MTFTSENNPVQVAWIVQAGHSPFAGQLGLTIAPGKQGEMNGKTHRRHLQTDLQAVRDAGADIIVNLMEASEETRWQMQGYGAQAAAIRLQVRRFAIPDVNIPADGDAFKTFVRDLYAQLQLGKGVVVHCLGGLGRSGTLAACLLIEHGLGAEEAITLVRKCRSQSAIEGPQPDFVRRYIK